MKLIKSCQYNLKMIRDLTIIILIFIFLSASNLFSQVTEEWVARYNGSGYISFKSRVIVVDSSCNVYVIVNKGDSETSLDYAIIKYNSEGEEQWVSRYNSPNNDWDEANAIAVDSYGNVYLTGESVGYETYYDYATVKYNSSGVEQWVRRYNFPGTGYDNAYAITVDNIGNVYITGRSKGSSLSYDYATIKYNNLGIEQWVARYNSGTPLSDDRAYAIVVDNSGNVYVTGCGCISEIEYDYVTVKYNGEGVEQWISGYNGPSNFWDEANSITIDDSGNVYVTGWSANSNTYPNSLDYATVKYNSEGIEQWVARYDGPGNGEDRAKAIVVDNSGNVYVTGWSNGSGTYGDYATIKYNSSGVEQWVSRYNGPGNSGDGAFAIAIDSSGNIYVTGDSYGSGTLDDYATIKYNSSGVEQWVVRYNGPGNGDDVARGIAIDNSGNVYVTGHSDGLGTLIDYATIKYSQSTFSEPFYLY